MDEAEISTSFLTDLPFHTERRPFKSPGMEHIMQIWFDANDSIVPRVVSRAKFEEQEHHLVDTGEVKMTLYLADDLQLWEIIPLIREVDNDTYKNKSEQQPRRVDKLMYLASTFKNSGIYIAQRLEGVREGKALAEHIAREFYSYGEAMLTGKRVRDPEEISIDEIKQASLSEDEVESVDRFLVLEHLYKSRRSRIDPSLGQQGEELIRTKTLVQFFRVLDQAYRMDQMFRGTSDSVHGSFISRIDHNMQTNIDAPMRELYISALDRGMQKLLEQLKEPPVDPISSATRALVPQERRLITERAKIPELKRELSMVQETGTLKDIAAKELEVARKIQEAVRKYDYKVESTTPMKILFSKSCNCVGYAIIGAALLEEVGLRTLIGHVPQHVTSILVTADNRVHLIDMQAPNLNREIKEEDFEGVRSGNASSFLRDTRASVSDIVQLYEHQSNDPISIKITEPSYREEAYWHRGRNKNVTYMHIYNVQHGLYVMILNNVARYMMDRGEIGTAKRMYEDAVRYGINYEYIFANLGDIYLEEKDYENAEINYRLALKSEPSNPYRWDDLIYLYDKLDQDSKALEIARLGVLRCPQDSALWHSCGYYEAKLGNTDNAIIAYRKAIDCDPSSLYSYKNIANMYREQGDIRQAIENYEKFLSLANKTNDADDINFIKELLPNLREKILSIA